jgi:hypothetical protein
MFSRKNHKACSSGFDLDQFPELKELNSQVAEQYNSIFDRIRLVSFNIRCSCCRSGQVSYMSQGNFMRYVPFFVAQVNRSKRHAALTDEKAGKRWAAISQMVRRERQARDNFFK